MLKYIYVFFISALPLIEIRGSIPYSQAMDMPYLPSIIVAIIGNMLPIPIVYFVVNKILIITCEIKFIGKISKYILDKGHKASIKLNSSNKSIYLAILLFVAIPFPGTGAYSAILASSILELDFKKSLLSIFLGVCISGVIMSIFSLVFKL